MADIVRQKYYGRYITADILQQIYYGSYMTANILWQIYYGRYLTADISWLIYYSRYITADMLRQISYGRYIMADTLWQTYCVQQKRLYLHIFLVPEAVDCCVRTCLLQRIAPRTPLDRFVSKEAAKINKMSLGPPHGERRFP